MKKKNLTIFIMLLAAAAAVSYGIWRAQAVNLRTGLVGHWTMDSGDINGTTVYDKSGNGNNGTRAGASGTNNTPQPTDGRIDGALDFDGTDDYVGVPYTAELAPTSQITLGGWAYRSNWTDYTSDGKLISKTQGGGYQLSFNASGGWSGYAAFLVYTNGSYKSAKYSLSNLSDGWHHFFGSYDGRYIKFYVDGALVDTYDGGSFPITYTYDNSLMIGAEADTASTPEGYYFPGKIDDTRLYNRALSADEVKALYNSTKETYIVGAPPRSGLVGHWTMDSGDINGTTVYDKSGNGNNGTSANTPNIVNGKVSEAMNFNGTNDWINLGQPETLDLTGPFTLAAWINTDNVSGVHWIIGKWYRYQLRTNNNGVQTSLISNDNLEIANCVADNQITISQWYHIAGIEDGSNLKVYVNGSLVKTCATAVRGTYENNVVIGRAAWGSAEYFDGRIDDIRVYSRALSADEIKSLYNSTKEIHFVGAPPRSGLVGHWTMDSGDINGTTVYDKSGNGNNGTRAGSSGANNTPQPTTGRINGALNFDGTDDYVSAADSISLSATDEISVSTWIKINDPTVVQSIVSKYDSGADLRSYYVSLKGSWCENGEILLAISSTASSFNGKVLCSLPLIDTDWHHMVVTFIPSVSMKIYIDGLDSSDNFPYGSSIASGIADNDRPLAIGAGFNNSATPNSSFLSGDIDDVRIYNRALSADEVKALYYSARAKHIQ